MMPSLLQMRHLLLIQILLLFLVVPLPLLRLHDDHDGCPIRVAQASSLVVSIPESRDLRPLAVRENRKDPLHHLGRYKGGFNPKSRSYWASTAFTGIYGYVVAIVWLFVGIISKVGFLNSWSQVNGINGKRNIRAIMKQRRKLLQEHRYIKRGAYIVAFMLTIISIGACIMLLVTSSQFHSDVSKVENIIENSTTDSIRMVKNATLTFSLMEDQLHILESQGLLPNNSIIINTTDINVNADLALIKISKLKSSIRRGSNALSLTVIVLSLLNFILIFLVPAFFLISQLRGFFCMVAIISWIVIALDWLLFGIQFGINRFFDDSCLALKEYKWNPYNTTLDQILPCTNLEPSKRAICRARKGMHDSILQTNKRILKIFKGGLIQGHRIPLICDPFNGPPHYDYTGDCLKGTIPIDDVPEVLNIWWCLTSNKTNNCDKKNHLYEEAIVYTKFAQNFIQILPNIERLTNCSIVIDTLSIFELHNCEILKESSQLAWIASICLSLVMVFTTLMWLFLSFIKTDKDILIRIHC